MIPVALLQPSSELGSPGTSCLDNAGDAEKGGHHGLSKLVLEPLTSMVPPAKKYRQSRQSLLLTSFDFHLRSTLCQISTCHPPKVPAAIARTVPRPTHPAMWPHDIGFIVFHPMYSVRLIHN
jgi:hypothetical protein